MEYKDGFEFTISGTARRLYLVDVVCFMLSPGTWQRWSKFVISNKIGNNLRGDWGSALDLEVYRTVLPKVVDACHDRRLI